MKKEALLNMIDAVKQYIIESEGGKSQENEGEEGMEDMGGEKPEANIVPSGSPEHEARETPEMKKSEHETGEEAQGIDYKSFFGKTDQDRKLDKKGYRAI